MLYTDKASIEAYLGTTFDASLNSQIDGWIAAVSAYINGLTGRVFIADGSASARRFEGSAGQKLLIDDCVAITQVEIGDTYGDSYEITTDYIALPLNDLPKTIIALKNRGWGVGIHRVTAKWGYSVACPDDIKFAATVLAAGIANTHARAGAAKKSEQIGNYSVSYDTDQGVADYERVLSILETYTRITL